MAQFSYENYAAQQEARKANSNNANGGLGPEVHFMNEFLKNDGDVAVVRFPYHTMNDIVFETTHAVTFPGKKYPSRVRCAGNGCRFCADGNKVDTRFFAKLIVYVVDENTGEVKLLNGVWDRPSAFADIDIKNLMQEYGDISQHLFKIKRNGSGTATRYTISIIMNTTVYNPAVYKADFSEIEKVDPVKILSKSIAQYNEALNPSAANTAPVTQPQTSVATSAAPAAPVDTATSYAAVNQTVSAATTQTVITPNVQPQAPAEERRQTRYTF